MMTLLLKSYFSILLSVGIGAILIFALGLYWIFRISLSRKAGGDDSPQSQSLFPKNTLEAEIVEMSPDISDISSIAGEDVIATQLDLARAYVESGKIRLAKKILESIVEQGSHAQQNEAKELLGLI